jgi:two-component system sensor histidine kinase BaeS
MRSLFFKLTIAFLVVGLVGSVVVLLLSQFQNQRALDRFVLDMYQSESVAELIAYYQENETWDGVQQAVVLARRPTQVREFVALAPVMIVDPDERVVFGRPEDIGKQIAVSTQQKLPLEVDGEVIGWMVVSRRGERLEPGSPEGNFLDQINQNILVSAGIAVLLALALGFLLARTISRPIQELRAATHRVAGGSLGYQVPVRTKDELGQLAASFNQMSSDLAHSNDLRRQMTADVAHELRNPLSVLLGYTEALSDGKLSGSASIFQSMHVEALHLQRLIDDLRTLSLADAGELPLARQSISLQALIERTVLAYASRASQHPISLRTDVPSDLPNVHVDPDRMAQVLGNLVQNAFRHTPEGGEIALSAVRRENGIELRVSDTGGGIAAADLPHIFDRFYRGDRARHSESGESGLGLAIVRSIIEAHGGSISVESSMGEGSIFTVTLPVAE